MWRKFWRGIWQVVKGMGTKGIISFIIVWVVLSGAGVIVVGVIIKNAWLIGIGTTMALFWLGPATPLIPLTIAIAMLFQRFVLRDKNISWKGIKANFKNAFHNERKKRWKYKDLARKKRSD